MDSLYKSKKIICTSLKNIKVKNGNVLSGLKKNDIGFNGFGEAYFSSIKYNKIKGWKKHKNTTMNFIVPIGNVKFIIFDEKNNKFYKEKIGEDNYKRLTITKNLWFGFMGLSKKNSIILNIINKIHNPNETKNLDLNKIDYSW